jgi:very-short-patch-repair endonuclease
MFLDETEDVYCVWRTEFSEDTMLCRYSVDLFARRGELWELNNEEHTQRAYTQNELEDALKAAGFEQIRFFGQFSLLSPDESDDRIFICAARPL